MNRMLPRGVKMCLVWALLPAPAFAQAIAPATSAITSSPTAAQASPDSAPPASPSPITVAPGASNVSPLSTVRWQSPSHCPAPRANLDELLGASSKHPLWGSVQVTEQPPVWVAHLHLRDGPPDALNASASDRVIQGNTCEEVTEAALLIVSIMQREHQELAVALADSEAATVPSVTVPLTPALPPPAAPLAPKPYSPPQGSSTPQVHSAPQAEPPLATSSALGVGAAWALWNGKSPALGVVAEFEQAFGRFSIRPQLGWSSTVNHLPTSESVKVNLTTYDAGLRLCFNVTLGINACAGPTLQRITVVGREIGEPTESSAWFPGASAAVLGSQEQAGLGLWGEIGANLRFKQIALEVNPSREVATVKRLTVYAWVGPQWRWR